jgi:predicted AAA+ superfamily ATPase
MLNSSIAIFKLGIMYQRILQQTIENNLFKGKTIVLYGARQVGKTTLAKNILKNFSQKSKYIDCDLLENRLALQVESAEKLKKFLDNYDLIVLNEAQRIKNVGLNLKIIHDHFPEIQIIATGSSRFELSNQINEPLTGRTFEYMLFPFSVKEISEVYDYAEIKSKFDSILRFGFYPDVFLSIQYICPWHRYDVVLKTMRSRLWACLLHIPCILTALQLDGSNPDSDEIR